MLEDLGVGLAFARDNCVVVTDHQGAVTLVGNKHRVTCLDVSSDGLRLTSGSVDGKVTVWDRIYDSEWVISHTFCFHDGDEPMLKFAWVTRVLFVANDTHVMASRFDGVVEVWKVGGTTVLPTRGVPLLVSENSAAIVTFDAHFHGGHMHNGLVAAGFFHGHIWLQLLKIGASSPVPAVATSIRLPAPAEENVFHSMADRGCYSVRAILFLETQQNEVILATGGMDNAVRLWRTTVTVTLSEPASRPFFDQTKSTNFEKEMTHLGCALEQTLQGTPESQGIQSLKYLLQDPLSSKTKKIYLAAGCTLGVIVWIVSQRCTDGALECLMMHRPRLTPNHGPSLSGYRSFVSSIQLDRIVRDGRAVIWTGGSRVSARAWDLDTGDLLGISDEALTSYEMHVIHPAYTRSEAVQWVKDVSMATGLLADVSNVVYGFLHPPGTRGSYDGLASDACY